MAGSSTDDPRLHPAQPRFYYDFASPEAYLAAERVMHVLPEVPEWIPVRLDGLAAGGVGAFRCAEEETIYREDVEARAARGGGVWGGAGGGGGEPPAGGGGGAPPRRYGLQAIRWPEPFPADT